MNKTNVAVAFGSHDQHPSNPENHNPSVSALSKFDDLIWDFSHEITNPTYTTSVKIIRWDFKISGGRNFDDPKFSSLRLACKQFLYALLRHPERNVRFKPDTVVNKWRVLRPFVSFLIRRARPILRFKDVTRHVADEYLKLLIQPNKKGRKRVKGSLYSYFAALQLLYVYRSKISDSIQFDPFEGKSPSNVLGLTSAGVRSKTECIPDNILHGLVTSALDYLKHSEALLEAVAVIERIRQEHSAAHRSTTAYHVERRIPGAISHLMVNIDVSFSLGQLTLRGIAGHLIRLRTACFILIAFVTGMRLSELLSLEAGCVEKESTDDGEFIWIKSTIHKRLGGRVTSGRWLCGPVAAQAVCVLEKLTADLRNSKNNHKNNQRLFIPVTRWGAHTWNGISLGATSITSGLREYVKWLDLRDGNGDLFPLHSHMFRRTFARHVVRSDTTNLLALKDHFKHVSLAMTDYYVGVDEELQDLLNDEANRLSFESFDKALRSDRLGGPRGKELIRQVDAAVADGRLPPEFRGEAGAHLRKEMIAEWVNAGQQIYPCGPGNICWFREGSALCTKGDRPVVEICNPLGCSNSVVLPEHESHWRSVSKQAEGLLRLNPPGEPYRQRLHTIVRIANKVIGDVS